MMKSTGGPPAEVKAPRAEKDPQARLKIFCTPKTTWSPAATRKRMAAWKMPLIKMLTRFRLTGRGSLDDLVGAEDEGPRDRQIFQPLIQSRSLVPAGFIARLVETTSIGSMVTKS